MVIVSAEKRRFFFFASSIDPIAGLLCFLLEVNYDLFVEVYFPGNRIGFSREKRNQFLLNRIKTNY